MTLFSRKTAMNNRTLSGMAVRSVGLALLLWLLALGASFYYRWVSDRAGRIHEDVRNRSPGIWPGAKVL
jgi:hypothetical protein